MIDFNLVEIYGYETKMLNHQVKNNIENLMKISTYKDEWQSDEGFGGRRYMLMTVLRGKLAIKQRKALIRMYKQMKDFVVENHDVSDIGYDIWNLYY